MVLGTKAGKIYWFIKENPGVMISEILREFSNYGTGSVYRDLRTLHADGLIGKSIDEESGEAIFYPIKK